MATADIDDTGNPAGARRITVLDGWRGVSILLVIAGHLVEFRYGMAVHGTLEYQLADAVSGLGVYIFFTISGLIITTLALRELGASGRFSARTFYLRRFFRIIPPFYLYLLCVLILTVSGSIAQLNSQTLRAAAFTCDLPHADCGWFAAHSWSLAYEEQYYLLFPLLLILFGRYLRVVVGLLFLAFVGVQVLHSELHLGSRWSALGHATFNFSFICIGALTATWADRMKRLCADRAAPWISLAAALILTGVVTLDVASHVNPESWRILHARKLLMPPLEPVCIAWLVGASVYQSGWGTRLLNARPLQFVGMISYSLYIWQQAFTASPVKYLGGKWLLFPPLMIICAVLSYYLVEQPCVRLAKRFVRPPASPLPAPSVPYAAAHHPDPDTGMSSGAAKAI